MTDADIQALIPYLAGICAFYLLPLLISSRAKRDEAFAGTIVATLAGAVFLLASIMFPLAGLVGPLRLADYLFMLLVYIGPGIFILLLWVGALRLFKKANP